MGTCVGADVAKEYSVDGAFMDKEEQAAKTSSMHMTNATIQMYFNLNMSNPSLSPVRGRKYVKLTCLFNYTQFRIVSIMVFSGYPVRFRKFHKAAPT